MSHPRRAAIPAPHAMLAAAIVILAILAALSPASAEVVEGSCTGTLTMDDDVVVDAAQPPSTPIVIPASGTLQVEGSFDREVDEAEEVAYRGDLRGQHPFGSWVIASWAGESAVAEVSATESYAIPSFVPRGSGPIPVEVDIDLGGETCRIAGAVAVAGATFDGLTIALLLATLLLLVAVGAAGRSSDTRRSGRPILGLIAGLFAGATGAASLFGVGVIALDSYVWWVAPVVVAALGLALGALGPFGRRSDSESAPSIDGGGEGSVREGDA